MKKDKVEENEKEATYTLPCLPSGLAYFTDVRHYLVWVYLSFDRETCITDQPFGQAV